jgi:two-component system nitrate/nitrite response regulator NarL
MNVVLCDQQRMFSEAFARVLEGHGWNVVSMTTAPSRAVAAVSCEHVDLCIMELSFPEGDAGIAGIAAMHEVSPDTKVVVLTASSDPQLIVSAVQAGADAVVFKDDDIDFIVEIIGRVDHGSRGAIVTGGLSGLTDASRCPATSPTTGRDADALGRFLTAREYEVLQCLVDGQTGKRLARDLGMAYSTARTHIQNILSKLGVHSQLEAVAFAIQHDLCRRTSQPAVAVARDQPAAAA